MKNSRLLRISLIFAEMMTADAYAATGFIGGALGVTSAPGFIFNNDDSGKDLAVVNDIDLAGNDRSGFLTLENTYVYQFTGSTSASILAVTPMYKYCFFAHSLCLGGGIGVSQFLGSTYVSSNQYQAQNTNFSLTAGIDYNINSSLVTFVRLFHYSDGSAFHIGPNPNPGPDLLNLGVGWIF